MLRPSAGSTMRVQRSLLTLRGHVMVHKRYGKRKRALYVACRLQDSTLNGKFSKKQAAYLQGQ